MATASAWRLAKSLDVLRTQINELSKDRSKASDGTKGDAAHAARKSDHNPDSHGVVHAMDITNDPLHGMDGKALANALLHSRDPRIDYVISRREIAYGSGGKHPWLWQAYTGTNPHDHHTHISVRDEPKLADGTQHWDLSALDTTGASNPPVQVDSHPTIAQGTKGASVERLQKLLAAKGFPLVADGDFGERTDKAVRAFQKKAGALVDGVVGRHTWDLLETA